MADAGRRDGRLTVGKRSIADRLMARSVVSDGHGDPPQDKPCLLTTYTTTKDGYGHIWANGKTSRVHVEAYRLWVGPIPEGMHVTHKCNVRRCFEPTHLEAGTNQQNSDYRVACGRASKGETHPKAKLTTDQVVSIRQSVAAGASMRGLASAYDVSYIAIRDIVLRKNWKHVA